MIKIEDRSRKRKTKITKFIYARNTAPLVAPCIGGEQTESASATNDSLGNVIYFESKVFLSTVPINAPRKMNFLFFFN